MSDNRWYGIDLDGTLAHYDGWKGIDHIGEPVPAMVALVERLLSEGKDVRIFTARVWHDGTKERRNEALVARRYITEWTIRVFGRPLPVTNIKDFDMVALYDDRAFQVEQNTGVIIGPSVMIDHHRLRDLLDRFETSVEAHRDHVARLGQIMGGANGR